MTKNTEAWMPVFGFEGLYEISESGIIRSVERTVNKRTLKSVIMKPRRHIRTKKRNNGYGDYVRVDLHAGGRRYTRYVARLVWESFAGPIPEGLEIDHINGDKTDNSLGNLRCCTHRVNVLNPVTKYRCVRKKVSGN